MVTIKDVAKKAGVNASTVSRVLKDSASISAQTKEKVRQAMTDLGYVPNAAAQMLASGLTQCVGVILPPLVNSDRISEPFFMEILTTIIDEAKRKGFTVALATGKDTYDLETQVKMMHRQKRVDGFIVLYSEKDDPVRTFLNKHHIPFVIVGAPTEYGHETIYIDNDNQLMARTAVDYLYSKGHRNLLFVTDDLHSEVFLERYLGYVKGVTKQGLTRYDAHLFDMTVPETVVSLVEKVEEYDISAVIVIGDMLSLRIIQLFDFYKMTVPDDISLISFNNSIYSTMLHPHLTTFDINVDNLGRNSFNYLLSKINKSEQLVSSVIVPFHLEERESVIAYRKKE